MKLYKRNRAERCRASEASLGRFFWLAPLVVAIASVCLAATSSDATADDAPAKINLRILYAGEPQSVREKDFVSFLKDHFAAVDKKDLAAFREQDANQYDAVVLDYGELIVSDKRIVMPKFFFSPNYSRPTMTLGAAGGMVCSRLKLKTGYL
jgi:hypothetical protein